MPAVGHRHRHRPGPGEDGGQIGFAFELGDGAGCRGADCELGEGIRAVLESLRCDRITRHAFGEGPVLVRIHLAEKVAQGVAGEVVSHGARRVDGV